MPLLQIDIFQSTFDSQIDIICSKSITLHNPHIIHSYICKTTRYHIQPFWIVVII